MAKIKFEKLDGPYAKIWFGDRLYFCVHIDSDGVQETMVEYMLDAGLHEALPGSFVNVGSDEDPASRRVGAHSAAPSRPAKAPEGPPTAAPTPIPPADAPAEAEALPVASAPSQPTEPWPGISREQMAYYELTGWYKFGMKQEGKGPYSTLDTMIVGSSLCDEEFKEKLFKSVSTDKWWQIREVVDVSPELMAAIDKKHFEYGELEKGEAFRGLPKADPREYAKAKISVSLPVPKPPRELSVEAAANLFGSKKK